MNAKGVTKELVIEKARELFHEKGYHQTSMSDIADACMIKKASLYHHIPSREAIVLAVLKQEHDEFLEHFKSISEQDSLNPNEKLLTYASIIENYFIEQEGCYLIGQFLLGPAKQVDGAFDVIKNFFLSWTDFLVDSLSEIKDEKDATKAANELVTEIHGAVMLQPIDQEYHRLRSAIQKLKFLAT